jgi:hypothetical protein
MIFFNLYGFFGYFYILGIAAILGIIVGLACRLISWVKIKA